MGKHRHSRSRSRSHSRSRSKDRKHKKHKKEKKHKRDSDYERDVKPVLPQNIPYSDMDNPFNDPTLTASFVWGKKLKVEGKDSLSRKRIEQLNRDKIHRNLEEMDKLKRERDARQAAREDLEMIARDEEKRQNADWKRVENAFHLNQAEMRSKIRIKENRPMPIDLLMRYIAYGEPSESKTRDQYEDFELEQSTNYIKNLDSGQLEDLLEDIKVSRLLFKGKNQEFWDDITTLVKAELKKLKNDRPEENIHSSVMTEVLSKFEKKSFAELKDMEKDIVNQIKSRSRGIDVSFWEEVLDLLHPKMARARLKELHSKKMKMRLEQIRAEQKKATEKHEKEHNIGAPSSSRKDSSTLDDMDVGMDVKPVVESALNKEDFDTIEAYDMSRPLPFTLSELEALEDEQKEQKWTQLTEGQLNRFVVEMYNAGGYSPKYLNELRTMPGIDVLDEKDDAKKLKDLRANKGKPLESSFSANETRMMEIA
ncbi:Cactin [Aphelenchoides bicaudatus]|nr:Cactin [Aphelenchoides bicaudatus]